MFVTAVDLSVLLLTAAVMRHTFNARNRCLVGNFCVRCVFQNLKKKEKKIHLLASGGIDRGFRRNSSACVIHISGNVLYPVETNKKKGKRGGTPPPGVYSKKQLCSRYTFAHTLLLVCTRSSIFLCRRVPGLSYYSGLSQAQSVV